MHKDCEIRKICSGCKEEINEDSCWCGDDRKMHTGYEGYTFVSMGCMCHYFKQKSFENVKKIGHDDAQ